MALKDLVEFILKHAHEHYEDGGWDVLVECWDKAEIESRLHEHGAFTEAEALAVFAPLVDVWADRQADADYHMREALGSAFAPEGWTEIEGGPEHER